MILIGVLSFFFLHLIVIEKPFKVSLTISAKLNALEVSWYNLKTPNDGFILLTDEEPQRPFRKQVVTDVGQQSHQIYTNEDNSTYKYYAEPENIRWTYGKSNKQALYQTKPTETNGWITTNVIFDNKHLEHLSATTKCYGYWAVYIDNMANPVFVTCVRAYATWMNDNKDLIKRFKFRDLFILGSHDSGSFRTNFNSSRNETLVTKYALTQVSALIFFVTLKSRLMLMLFVFGTE